MNVQIPSITATNNQLKIVGELSFETIPVLYKIGEKLILNVTQSELTVDLQEVLVKDISALALLLGWFRTTHHLSKTIKFNHLPKNLISMIELNNLQIIL